MHPQNKTREPKYKKQPKYEERRRDSTLDHLVRPVAENKDKKVDNKYSYSSDSWLTEGRIDSKEDSESKKKHKSNIDSYDPSKSSRELNPYWKNGGNGLPNFQKPKEEDNYKSYYTKKASGNWRKKNDDKFVLESAKTLTNDLKKYERNNDSNKSESKSVNETSSEKSSDNKILNKDELNRLGSKLFKAELMGNDELAKELREKLKRAQENYTNNCKSKSEVTSTYTRKQTEKKKEHILLTTTNNKGMTKPLGGYGYPYKQTDPWGGRQANKRKKTETHFMGERVQYFPDDDKYDIKQMFEREKYTTGHDSDAQFLKIASKHKNPKDDLDDIFSDKVRESTSDYDRNEKEKRRAIAEHEKYSKILESCERCFDSSKMKKSLMISMGARAYLSIPYHEALQPGHCLITSMEHISCSTQLDEDGWNEITEFRKAITRMFANKSQEVIFFEIANYLHKKPHMVIHCVPGDNFEMAPMYFKKAIQESEYEWSTNKQLITLKERDLRQSIPKGLPYFWVHFGMDLGFAHVIEDQHKFKSNFAQEIIGGMLNLNYNSWRKPKKQEDYLEKVKEMAKQWRPFDFTK